MTKKRRTYTAEFKEEAVNLVKEIGITKASKDLGVDSHSFRSWKMKAQLQPDLESEVNWKKEAMRLQKEVQYLKKINDVLKKSTAIFSQDEFPPFK